MKFLTKILVSLGIVGVFGASVPIVPQDMHFVAAFQGPYDAQIRKETVCVRASSSSPCKWTEQQVFLGREVFPDDDGNGVVSWAQFADHKGNKVTVQIPDEQYNRMGKKKERKAGVDYGALANPKKDEYISLFQSLTADAAVAFYGATGGQDNTGATSVTVDHFITSTSTGVVLAAVWTTTQADSGTATTSSVQYNASDLTFAAGRTETDGSANKVTVNTHYHTSPDTGNNNLVVTISEALTGNKQFAVKAVSYTGGDSTQPNCTANNGSNGTNPSSFTVSGTAGASTDWMVGGASEAAGGIVASDTPGANTAYRGIEQFNMYAADSDGNASPTALVWNRTTAGNTPLSGALFCIAAAGGGAAEEPNRSQWW